MATTQSNGEYELSDDLSALDVLLDGDIDKVMANLDRIVEAAPSYKKLISRWENQGWSSRPSTSPATPRSGTTAPPGPRRSGGS